MRHLPAIALLAALVLLPSCGSSPEFAYTGQNEDAAEGSYIKDPEAVGRVGGDLSRPGARAESNRVDIPVLEFVTMQGFSYVRAAHATAGLKSGTTRTSTAMGRIEETYLGRIATQSLRDASSAHWLNAEAGRMLFAAVGGREEVNVRSRHAGVGAASSLRSASVDSTVDETMAYVMRQGVNAARTQDGFGALASRAGYETLRAERVIGLRLWKYADRDIVADNVEITYTIVFYNSTEHNTGPTEIVEPVPYYTEFMTGSATLPFDGVTVAFEKRPGGRNVLRWRFPAGIKAGDTGKMTYKVTVRLEDSYAPRGDDAEEPGER